MAERTLTVRIVGDDKSLQQAFARGGKGAKGFEAKVSGLGPALTRSLVPVAASVIGVQAAFSGISASVSAASSLNEEVSKSKQIFGASSSAVLDWSSTTASAIGVSQVAALQATGIFGNLLNTVGLAPDKTAAMSRGLVELAADLASFNNASPEDVLDAIRSGLIGEAEPLRRYGVLLSETRVQQVAMATTGKKSAASLTDQEKALARYQIILEDTRPAQGDFARTSEGLANQTRILRANMADLAATLGGVLLPVVNKVVGGLNDMFDVAVKLNSVPFGKTISLEGVSLTKLIEARDRIAALRGETDLLVVALDKAITKLDQTERSKLTGRGGFPTDLPGALAATAARNAAAARRRAKRTADADAKAFVEHMKGLGLKLDKAGLDASSANDLAVLREMESSILRRMRAEGKTFDLVSQLTSVRGRIATLLAGDATDAAEAASSAFSDAIDALELRLDIAKTTRGFGDDMVALRKIEQQVLARIRVEGRTTDLLRQLFANRQEQAETLRNQRIANQFEALGLTASGEKPVPGRGALSRRAKSLQEQIKGTALDTDKTRSQLRRIARVLAGEFGKVGRDVRSAILDMLNDISSALEGGSTGKKGPMTAFAKRGVEGLTKGLGLTEDQVKEIRQRFSRFSRFDVAAPTGGGSRPPRGSGRTTTTTRQGENIIIHVYLDGQEIETRVTRRQQKKRGRNAASRRGFLPGGKI